jgi:hypothetical protein
MERLSTPSTLRQLALDLGGLRVARLPGSTPLRAPAGGPDEQTEQECGDGRNDWRYCRYAWTLVKHYLRNGANVYLYWNISLRKGGVSRWGWAQNSLVTVDSDARTYAYTHEYYLMEHLSHFVRPGARRVEKDAHPGWLRLR